MKLRCPKYGLEKVRLAIEFLGTSYGPVCHTCHGWVLKFWLKWLTVILKQTIHQQLKAIFQTFSFFIELWNFFFTIFHAIFSCFFVGFRSRFQQIYLWRSSMKFNSILKTVTCRYPCVTMMCMALMFCMMKKLVTCLLYDSPGWYSGADNIQYLGY